MEVADGPAAVGAGADAEGTSTGRAAHPMSVPTNAMSPAAITMRRSPLSMTIS